MIAVLTGDIVNSRKGDVTDWLPILKKVLDRYGNQDKDWEIFRGDSFQLSVAFEDAFIVALHIKAAIRETDAQDVRLGIGIGEQTHSAVRITESNGAAFIRSGESFESLKKNSLSIKSGDKDWNNIFNLLFLLAMLTADYWSQTVAQAIRIAIENPEKTQKEIAQILKKSQSTVSGILKRGGYDELMKVNAHYRKYTPKP